MKKYVLLEGTYYNPNATNIFDRGNIGDRWTTLNSPETDNKPIGFAIDYAKVIGYADSIAEAQIFLYGKSYTDATD